MDTNETLTLNSIAGNIFTIDSLGKFSKKDPYPDTATYSITAYDSIPPAVFYQAGPALKGATVIKAQWPGQAFNFQVEEDIFYSHFGTTRLSNNDLIFYCGQTLVHIRQNKSFTVKRFKSQILNVFEDYEKQLWIGCYNDGVYVCDSSCKVLFHYFTDLTVSHVFADYEKGLWLSTLENGIYYLPSKGNLIFSVQGKILNEKITAISNFSDSILFFTASNETLYKLSSSNAFSRINLKKEFFSTLETVNFLYNVVPEKELLVAYSGRFNDAVLQTASAQWQGFKVILAHSSVRFIPYDSNHLLGGGYSFIYSFDKYSLTKNIINKTDFHATVLFKDSKERLFAGTLNQLSIYSDSSFIYFDSTNSILKKRVTDLGELNNNCLVIATRSDGIILYSDTVLGIINSANGLSSDNINHIVVNENTIWAGTNRGLNRIVITNYAPLTFTIRHYNIQSGLSSDEINDFTVVKNNIYVATNEGVSLIKVDLQNDAFDEMPVYINSVKINDQDTSVLNTYRLNYTQNTLNIKFAAVSFKQAKNITYLYRLLGQDSTWRSTQNRDVQLTNLPPGKYTFQLMGQSGSGVFPVKPLEIDFIISPPFYETLWFRIVMIFSGITILFLFLSHRIKNIKRKAEERNELNRKFSELNLNALRSQMNPHFTFNVLNSIQYYIAKKNGESAQLYITKFSRLIRMILDQSRTEFISLSEEIRILTLYIELEELRFEKKFSYSINIDAVLNTSGIHIPGMLIQPFVENSIKHGIRFKKGIAHVDINFKTSGSILICTITDNGIGRAEAAKLKSGNGEFKSVGTDIVQNRIEALGILLNGKVKNYISDLIDEQGNPAGTCVTIEVPYKTAVN